MNVDMGFIAHADYLRGRALRLKKEEKLRTTREFAAAVGLKSDLIARFFRAENVKMDSLEKIEEWCDRQEDSRRAS